VLKKRKKVFKNTEVIYVKGVPCESEFKVKKLLKMIENDAEVNAYLPDWTKKHVPDKSNILLFFFKLMSSLEYLCNIVNTVHKNSIVNWIK